MLADDTSKVRVVGLEAHQQKKLNELYQKSGPIQLVDCEVKKLDTVRVTKFCSKQHSDQQVPEKTRCFTSEGWRYWHFKADFPWRATSYWQFWKGHCFGQSYKHQSSQHCEWYTTPRCVVVLSWCYPPIDRLSQYQCGQQRKYTQANDCPVSQWERTWQN